MSSFDAEKLSIEDKELLGTACLLSLLKHSKEDGFGHTIYHLLIKNLGESISGGRKCQEKLISKVQEKFNLASTNFIKSSAGGDVKKILDKCKAFLGSSGVKLKALPCYAGTYAVIRSMEEKKLPIIISLTRIKGEENTLTLVSKDVFFYKFEEGRRAFCYKEQESLSEDEKGQLTIAFFCFSLISEGYQDKYKPYVDDGVLPSKKFLTESCDIRNLLIVSAAGHIQLSKHSELPDGGSNEGYAEGLYRELSGGEVKKEFSFSSDFHQIEENVSSAYDGHCRLAERLGMSDAQYSKHMQVDNGSSMEVTRRKENTLFAIDHVSLSSNSRERSRIEGLEVNTRLDQVEITKCNKKTARHEVASKIQRALSL